MRGWGGRKREEIEVSAIWNKRGITTTSKTEIGGNLWYPTRSHFLAFMLERESVCVIGFFFFWYCTSEYLRESDGYFNSLTLQSRIFFPILVEQDRVTWHLNFVMIGESSAGPITDVSVGCVTAG